MAEYESVVEEARQLLEQSISVTRELVDEVAVIESKNSKQSRRDRARGRWIVYLGVMLAKVAEGISVLVRTGNARPIIILSRCIFEYQQKAEFLLTHRTEAFEQLASIGARRHSDLSKLPPHQDADTQLLALYQEWQKSSGTRNEYSGNAGVSRMHLENIEKDVNRRNEILRSSDGSRYTSEFQTVYGLPSLYVHGEPLLAEEVFLEVDDWRDWRFRDDYTFIDVLRPLGASASYLLRFCSVTIRAYGLPDSLKSIEPLFRRVQHGMRAVRGPRA